MNAAPLRFHRPMSAIIRDMERAYSPSQYDRLLDEWVAHPEVVSTQAESDAIEALLSEQDREVDV